MEYKYFTLDKNPKQFKRISIGEYSIELRIEWNTRSKAWYVLGYSGDEIVISNVKMTPNQLYSIDIDSEYDLPYMIGIIPKYTNYDWDTETTFLIVDNPLSNAVEGLTADGGVIERSITTSSDTHSRKALKGSENKYLFDVVSITQDTGITIVCNGADSYFKTVNLPQGRWDFTINGMRTITADTEAFRSLMNDYGVQIVDAGNNEYLWTNNSDYEIKIEGLYPYAAGYDFNVVESSNESAKIHSVDNNGWVNRFTVCLSPFVDTVWEVYKTEVSEDYNDLVFRARKSLTGVKPSEEEALLEKYKSGLDVYSATIVNELTGVSDWILDSDNNRIGYFELEDEVDDVDGVASFGCNGSTSNNQTLQSALDSCTLSNWTQVELTEKGNETLVSTLAGMQVGQTKSTLLLEVSVVNTNNSNPTPVVTNMYLSVTKLGQPAEQEEKYLLLSTVATQVISNAANGDVNAEELLNSLNKYDSYAEVEILPLIVDRHKQGLDVYSSGIVNELTGVTDWVLDPDNNQIVYTKLFDPNVIPPTSEFYYVDNLTSKKFNTSLAAFQSYMTVANRCAGYPDYTYTTTDNSSSVSYFFRCSPALPKIEIQVPKVANPDYDPNGEEPEQPLPNIQYKSQDGILYQTMTALCSDYIPRSAYNTDYIFAGGARTVNGSGQPTPVEIGLRVQCDLKNRQSGSPTNTVGGNAVARTEAVLEEEKTLPLDAVAQQVISNAESGNVDAQKVALSVAFSPSLVSSLSDSDMQQWQAVKDAIGQLTGATEWTFDNADKVVRYEEPQEIEGYGILDPKTNQPTNSTLAQLCTSIIVNQYPNSTNVRNAQYSGYTLSGQKAYCNVSLELFNGYDWNPSTTQASTTINLYPYTATGELTTTYQQVVDKIIANSIAEDQGVSLLAEVYIQEALSKFTDVDSLSSQFEENKQPK